MGPISNPCDTEMASNVHSQKHPVLPPTEPKVNPHATHNPVGFYFI